MEVPAPELPLLDTQLAGEQDSETQQLKHSLKRLSTFLRFLGFFHDTPLTLSLSILSFLAVAVAAPSVVIFISYFNGVHHVKTFEVEVVICEIAVASVSLLCVSRNLRKYGLRKFLFVDEFQDQYVRKIDDFFRLLAIWIVPCFVLKIARELVKVIYVGYDSWLESLITIFILLVSWAYSSTIYLVGSSLFSLVCNLQAIHFENYRTLFERDLDILIYIQEHIRLTFHLSKISHRFRIFLIVEFLIVTASQFIALLETTANNPNFNFINGADFAISAIVQVAGIVICLHAASKMSHRAQGLASFVSRWHALATSNLNETTSNGGNSNSGNPLLNYSESDLESADFGVPSMNMEFISNMSPYHKRQAFVMYLQSNPGGVTIFGWTVDRALMNTIFFIELSVVTFVLGKTISFSAGNT